MSRLFLGLDSSTQSLTAVVVDLDARRVVYEKSLGFDATLPAYGTRNGVLRAADPCVVHAPPLMWAEALDLAFAQMKRDGVALGEILAVAVSGQQHGSVYLNDGFEPALAKLDPSHPLKDQLGGVFARATSPIWMDSSTGAECAEITAAFGRPQALAEATGSAAFERFTGPQIRKFFKQEPAAYEATAHIALVSSFVASLLAGRIVPVDYGDGAGMNLMDIRGFGWHPKALDATAIALGRRLPPPVAPWTAAGVVAPFFARRHGLRADARVIVGSGDNPNSVVGLGLVEPGMVAVSLGTSDTCFGTMAECRTDPRSEGHVFGSPAGGYMTLVCFKNGSLARERIRDEHRLDWKGFSAALRATKPGLDGHSLMLPWFEPEITPRVLKPGVRRRGLRADDAAANCRAVVEGQMLSMRNHTAWMGVRPSRIYATGGASANPQILQVMADIHGCPVFRFETTSSAALGAALRAAHGWLLASGAKPQWREIVKGLAEPVAGSEVRPAPDAAAVYDPLARAHAEFEREEIARG